MCEFIACEGFMHVFEKARMPYICIWGWGLVCLCVFGSCKVLDVCIFNYRELGMHILGVLRGCGCVCVFWGQGPFE